MRILYFNILFLLLCPILHAQDSFHQSLLDQLKDDHSIEPEAFLLSDNEATNVSDMFIYGGAARTIEDVSGSSYTKVMRLQNSTAQPNPWDSGTGIANATAVEKDDIVLLAFSGRSLSAISDMNVFIENSSSFEKEIYFTFSLTPDWNQYFIAFESSANFGVGQLALGLHFGTAAQEFEIAGFTAFNFKKKYPLSDVPSIFSAGNYGGFEEDAPWRALAASRIETLRKADLNVTVKDANGTVIEGATVKVEMQKHAFGFGSAFVGCRFPGNDCFDATYIEKITDLDGKGHGFNVGVTENALKWDAWEEEWLGSPGETVAAVEWLSDRGIEVRGHAMVWPGWQYLPEDLFENRTDLTYLRSRMQQRINRMLMDPKLSDMVREWDVLNEITQNRDLEAAFRADPNYSSGREVYLEIFDLIKNTAPNTVNYINDYVTLSGGGSGKSVTDRYKAYISEIIDGGAKVDGIGFQCHIGTQPTSILKIQETLNEFYQRYGKRMKITEYDIDDKVDEATQAKYLEDFLTIIFSHPGVDAFLMWGFWDGNHWKGNAPMFYEDWSLKPSGESFNKKVFGDWWTEEEGATNGSGVAAFRPFKGVHKITITKDGQSVETTVNLEEAEDIEVQLLTTNALEPGALEFELFPNPIEEVITVYFDGQLADLEVFSLDGRLQQSVPLVRSGESLRLDLAPGLYIVQLQLEDGQLAQKKVIQK
ncbi:MAG: endo-1,4-beta-xylanase [Bacteroidota bacterium]